jgi:hypothetical protein
MDDLNPLDIINRGATGNRGTLLCELHPVVSINQACLHLQLQVASARYKRVIIDPAVSLSALLPLLLKFIVKQLESSSERSIVVNTLLKEMSFNIRPLLLRRAAARRPSPPSTPAPRRLTVQPPPPPALRAAPAMRRAATARAGDAPRAWRPRRRRWCGGGGGRGRPAK